MIDIQLFVNALKLTWLRRLITSPSSQWAILFQLTFSSVKNILDFGSLWFKTLQSKSNNAFWTEIFEIAFLCLNECDYKSFDNLVCMPLWHNQNINNFTLIKSTWYNPGIVVIGDVISDGKFLSKEAIKLLYDLPEIKEIK